MIETFKVLPHSCVPYYRSLLKIHEESEKNGFPMPNDKNRFQKKTSIRENPCFELD